MPGYNAEKTLLKVFEGIPENFKSNVLLVDDASKDGTAVLAKSIGINTIVHKNNLGYGGNQKTCYQCALEKQVDIVVMLHPDGQYDPAYIPKLIKPIIEGYAQAVIGSRMQEQGMARKGGMPLWKYFSNKTLTSIANFCCNTKLTDWHSGYRAYKTDIFKRVDFLKNSNGYSFDVEITTQLLSCGFKTAEIAIPTKYFPEASSINFKNSVGYGFKFLQQVVLFKIS